MEIQFSDYKTITETAKEWNISRRMVIRYCEMGRIPGAIKGGNLWLLPKNTEKPRDTRGDWLRKRGSMSEEKE